MNAKLNSLRCWLRGLRHDRRWIKNMKISAALWALNFGLFYLGVTSFTSNTWLTNLVLSLTWDVVWYFINRYYLWKERPVSARSSASRSAAAWLFFFALNQSAFWLLVGRAEIDWYYAKPLLTMLSIGFGLARYFYNDTVAFSSQAQQTSFVLRQEFALAFLWAALCKKISLWPDTWPQVAVPA